MGDGQDAADDSFFLLSHETLILTDVSVLILLTGIAFAAKIKQSKQALPMQKHNRLQ